MAASAGGFLAEPLRPEAAIGRARPARRATGVMSLLSLRVASAIAVVLSLANFIAARFANARAT